MRNVNAVPVAAALGLAVLLAPTVSQAAPPPSAGPTYRVSLSIKKSDPNFPSTRARISQNGQFVVYQSVATNLVATDRNAVSDVFWTDLRNPSAPLTKRVSVGYDGSEANGISTFCDISADGQYVVFNSSATNLVPGSVHGGDVFRRDMLDSNPATATQLVSVSSTGRAVNGISERPTVSDDGRYVAFNSRGTNLVNGVTQPGDIYVRDMTLKRTVALADKPAPTGDESLRAEISGDGTHVAFASDLHLTPQDTNTHRDVYEADIRTWQATGSTTGVSIRLVSQSLTGTAGNGDSSRPGIDRDGSVVTYQSLASNLVADDTNKVEDAFYRDMGSATSVRVSVGPTGSQVNGGSTRPQPDDTGRYVAFTSVAPNLVIPDRNGRTDSFLRDMVTGKTVKISVTPSGGDGNCPAPKATGRPGVQPHAPEGQDNISTRAYLSGDGRSVVFVSGMCNLVTDAAHGGPDHNAKNDIFVRKFTLLP